MKMSDKECGQATHEEICDEALKHYVKISGECCDWCSTVEKAIKFYRDNFTITQEAQKEKHNKEAVLDALTQSNIMFDTVEAENKRLKKLIDEAQMPEKEKCASGVCGDCPIERRRKYCMEFLNGRETGIDDCKPYVVKLTQENARYRECIEQICNEIGGPTMSYAPAIALKLYEDKVQRAFKLAQSAIGGGE